MVAAHRPDDVFPRDMGRPLPTPIDVGHSGPADVTGFGRCKNCRPGSGSYQIEVDDILMALAEPIRRQVLDVIAAHGGTTVTTVVARLPITRQAAAQHLAVLDRAGLAAAHRRCCEFRYANRPDPLDVTARWMANVAEWDARLAPRKRLAESS